MIRTSSLQTQILASRDDLVVCPIAGKQGLIKDSVNDTYSQLVEQEWFLLSQLDSQANYAVVPDAFQRQCDEALSKADLSDFLEMVIDAIRIILSGYD